MSSQTLKPAAFAGGDVPMPEDPREIDAAVKAGRISYRVFPYFDWRFGERGRRFTGTDSSWMAWLVRHEQAYVNSQITWLWSVLSNRGMPGILIEAHLQVVARCLEKAIPEKAAAYRKLLVARDLLATQRNKILSDMDFARLSREFASRLAETTDRLTIGTGRVLVSAAVDQQCGFRNSVKSLLSWLSDCEALAACSPLVSSLTAAQAQVFQSSNFKARWSTAIQETLEKVDAAVRTEQ